MARTNLAEIDDTIQHAIEQENEAPRIAVGDTLKPIAGFWLPDEAATEQRAVSRRATITNYRRDRDALNTKLAAAQVTPLLTLPKVAWDRICRESGLYRIQPNDDGRIKVDASVAEWFGVVAVIPTILFWLGVSTALVWGLALLPVWVHGPLSLIGIFSAMISGIVALVIIRVGLDGEGPIPATFNFFTRCLAWLFGKAPRRVWLRTLLPGFAEPAGHSPTMATIDLPTPPVEIAAILRRAQAFKLSVATVPGAMAFREPYHRILAHEIAERHDARMTAWRSRPRLDPIIYVEHDSAVAIIAQFGDFPIEKEVVARVAASEHLL